MADARHQDAKMRRLSSMY